MKFKRSKCWVLHLGPNIPLWCSGWRLPAKHSSSAGKGLRVLVANKDKTNHSLVCVSYSRAVRSRKATLVLCSGIWDATSGVTACCSGGPSAREVSQLERLLQGAVRKDGAPGIGGKVKEIGSEEEKSILGDFQKLPGKGPEQPDSSLKLALPRAGLWTVTAFTSSTPNFLHLCFFFFFPVKRLLLWMTDFSHNIKNMRKCVFPSTEG